MSARVRLIGGIWWYLRRVDARGNDNDATLGCLAESAREGPGTKKARRGRCKAAPGFTVLGDINALVRAPLSYYRELNE